MYQAYSTDPRVNRPSVRKDVTRSGFSLADTLSDSAGVAYADKLKLAPEEIAQHAFAGPDMEAFLSNLAGKKVIMGGGTSRPRGRSLAEPMVPAGGDDGGYQNAVNAYLSELTDRNAAGQAQHEAQFAAEQKQGEIDRAMAIANDPNTSQFGRPIVPEGPMALGPSGRPVSASGTYATAPPAENAPPVNRQAVAAQMAPGLIAPPPPAPPVTFSGKPEAMTTTDGKRIWTRMGSDGSLYDLNRKPIDPSTLDAPPDKNAAGDTNVSDVVKGMMEGTLPPQLPGRASKDYIAIQAEAKRQGYDLAGAVTDWAATQKHIQTMNGAQQLRLNQAVNSLPEMLDTVDTLAGQWKGGRFPVLNKANLALAKGGAYGREAASVVNQLDAMIADVTADLGNVYMGGNSPTERALELAGKALNGEWDEKVLRDMVKLAKQNVQIRRNSINNTGVAGASAGNPYGNQGAAPGGTVMLQPPGGGPPRPVPADQVDHYVKLGATVVK